MAAVEQSRAVTWVWVVIGFATTGYYFSWLLQPERAGTLVLFALLVLADLFNGFHAVSFWLTSLRRRRSRPFRLPDRPRVDVLIPTYNEAVDVLEPTIRGALAMRGAHVRVLLLDDGDRPSVRTLARQLGAEYVARRDHGGAKAGNLNHALSYTSADGAAFVCVFDSDHVPDGSFLEQTLGYFTDPQVALVQTPQVYGNAKAGWLTRGAAEQQAVFFGPISRGRDGFNASLCCGTNFVVRRDVLERAGGFPMDSITEDIVLSARLVGLGYELVYVPEPLARGLGPADAHSYDSQQLRWATGCLQLLFHRRELWRPLSWTQRWQYLVATSYWLTGWTVVVYLALPVLRLLFGWQPLDAAADDFAIHFLPYFLVAIINLGRFTNGAYTLAGLAMNWGSFAIHIRGTLRALGGRPLGFHVTPKEAVPGPSWHRYVPNLVAIVLLLCASVAGGLGGLTASTFNNITFAAIDALLIGSIVAFAALQSRRLGAHADEDRAPVDQPVPGLKTPVPPTLVGPSEPA